MISLLGKILCVLRNLVLGVLWALCELVNLVIAGLGAFIALVVGLLPAVPEVPTSAPPKAVGWLAWGFPVATVLGAFGLMLTTYGIFLLARIALRWVKAI